MPTGNGSGVGFGTIAIAASAFPFATVEPGTSEFGISSYAPPCERICTEAAPPIPSACEGDGSPTGSVAIASLAFAFAAKESAVGEFGISEYIFPYTDE